MRKRLGSLILMAFCISIASVSEAWAEEPSEMVVQAVSVRVLQSELMVAALTCRGELGTSLVRNYNRFVRHFSPALIRSAKTLRAHFRKTYGLKHTKRFDSFLTKLANQASINAIRDITYCEDRAALAQTALNLDDADLEDFTVTAYVTRANLVGQELPNWERINYQHF